MMNNIWWFPESSLNHSSAMSRLSLCHRHRPLFGPYLLCAFASEHQFVCDTMVTTTSLSCMMLDQLDHKINLSSSIDTVDSSQYNVATHKRTKQHSTDWWQTNLCNIFKLVSLFVCSPAKRMWSCFSSCCLLFTHPYLLLIHLTFLAYWPSLWAELVFDDRPAIIENRDLRKESSWSDLWWHDYWGTPLKSVSKEAGKTFD